MMMRSAIVSVVFAVVISATGQGQQHVAYPDWAKSVAQGGVALNATYLPPEYSGPDAALTKRYLCSLLAEKVT